MPALEFKNISSSYTPGKPVLENASFRLGQGDSICIVGPNGGGKSTLIKLILGLEQPVEGEVLLFGKLSSPRRFSKAITGNKGTSAPDEEANDPR